MAEANNDLSETQGSSKERSIDEPLEGARLKTLRDVIGKTVKSFTRNLRLVKPFPGADKDVLSRFQKEAVSQLESNIQCEFSRICEEENIEQLLNTLDEMTAKNVDADKKLPGWKPSGNVETDLRAHIMPLKRDKLKALEKLLHDMEAQNKLLRNTAEKKENHLIQTKEEIAHVVNSLAKITDTEVKAVDSLD